jgi:hypothetical protein
MNPKQDDLDDVSDEEFEKTEQQERYKRLCDSRRNNGIVLLCVSGIFFYSAVKVSAKAQSGAEVFGAYAVPLSIVAAAAYYLLTRPKLK